MGITKILSILIGVVVTIITLAFVGGYIASVFSGTKVAQSASELSTVISNVQGLYASQPDFNGLTETVAVQGNVFPSNMVNLTSDTAVDAWMGNVTVTEGSAPTEFTVEFDSVPSGACNKLAMSYQSDNLVSLTVNGTSVTLPVTPAAVSPICSLSNNNDIIWTLD